MKIKILRALATGVIMCLRAITGVSVDDKGFAVSHSPFGRFLLNMGVKRGQFVRVSKNLYKPVLK